MKASRPAASSRRKPAGKTPGGENSKPLRAPRLKARAGASVSPGRSEAVADAGGELEVVFGLGGEVELDELPGGEAEVAACAVADDGVAEVEAGEDAPRRVNLEDAAHV